MLDFIFNKILFLSLSGGASVVILLILFTLFGGRLSGAVKYRLLILPMLLFLVPLSFSHGFSAAPVTTEQEENIPQVVSTVTDEDVTNIVGTAQIAPQSTAAAAAPTAPEKKISFSDRIFPLWNRLINSLCFIWLFAAAVVLTIKIVSILRFRRGLKKIALPPSEEMESVFNVKGARLYTFDTVSTPFVSGIFRPKVFMPRNCMTEREIQMALLHETIHIKRGDLILKAIAEFICTIHFFNPAAYIFRYFLDEYSELSCDEAVIRGMDQQSRKDYGRMLVSLSKKERICSSATCLSEGHTNIKRRINMIITPTKKSISSIILSAILIFAVTLGSVALAADINSRSTAEAPKATYVTDSVYNIFIGSYSSSSNFISEGGTAVYTDFLGITKFEMSWFAMNDETVAVIDSLSDEERYDEITAMFDDKTLYSDYYEFSLSSVTRKYGDGRYIEGLFTLTKNGEVYFENAHGFLSELPPDSSLVTYPNSTSIVVNFEKDGEQYIFGNNGIRFEETTYEEALKRRTAEKEFTLSRDTTEVRLGKCVEASVDGTAIDMSDYNSYLDNPERKEYYNYLTSVKYNVRLNEAQAYFDLGDIFPQIRRGQKVSCSVGTIKGDFLIFTNDYNTVTDVSPFTITGLDGSAGDFVTVASDDGRIYAKYEIVPYIEEPLNVYGTRSPEEFYQEGEQVFIGTPREQDDFDLENPDSCYYKRIVVDNNGKVLAVVPVEYQTGFLEKEDGKRYSQAPIWEQLFKAPSSYIVHLNKDGTEEIDEGKNDMIIYDMASWWIKVIIPAEYQYFEVIE